MRIRELKSLARKKVSATQIARGFKRTVAALRQKAMALGVSLDSRSRRRKKHQGDKSHRIFNAAARAIAVLPSDMQVQTDCLDVMPANGPGLSTLARPLGAEPGSQAISKARRSQNSRTIRV